MRAPAVTYRVEPETLRNDSVARAMSQAGVGVLAADTVCSLRKRVLRNLNWRNFT